MRIGNWWWLTVWMFPLALGAQQPDTLDQLPGFKDQVEDLLRDQDAEGMDFNTVLEDLQERTIHQLDINQCTGEDLAALRIWQPLDVANFLRYRENYGPFLSLYELQAVPGLELDEIKAILPYLKLAGNVNQKPFLKRMWTGNNNLFLRWSRPYVSNESTRSWLGGPDRMYIRYRHQSNAEFSYGFTAEQDPGEPFFADKNKTGFDFYSAHWFWRPRNHPWIKTLAIGDFTTSWGQGIVMLNGFGTRKGVFLTSIKQTRNGFNPYSGAEENNFHRGVAIETKPFPHIEVGAFASWNRKDANLNAVDSLQQENEELQGFSSLLTSGLHRTPSELADKDAILNFQSGISAKYLIKNGGHIGVQVLHDQIDRNFQGEVPAYRQFTAGQTIQQYISTDHSLTWRNLHWFGEWAVDQRGNTGFLEGLLVSLDRKLDAGLLFRRFSKGYSPRQGNPVAEFTGASNETGLMTNLEFRPGIRWTFQGYVDFYRSFWLRFGSVAPVSGVDHRWRITYNVKRKWSAYLEARWENTSGKEAPGTSPLRENNQDHWQQYRLQLSTQINKTWEWRQRIDYGIYKEPGNESHGWALYEDLLFKPIQNPFSFTLRWSIFSTDGYDVRFYSFENDLLNSFSIPPYYGYGIRYYLNIRFKGIPRTTLEGRFARTERPAIYNAGDWPSRWDIKFQLKYSW